MHRYIFVPGKSIQKGSMKAFNHRANGRLTGKKPIVTNDSKDTKLWQRAISAAARLDAGPNTVVVAKPTAVEVWIWFVMPRLKAGPKANAAPHVVKPDLDKLTRTVLDGLTGIAYEDDAQVDTFGRVRKRRAQLGEVPGVHIAYGPATFELGPQVWEAK